MLVLSLSVWFSLRNPHLTCRRKVYPLGSVQVASITGKEMKVRLKINGLHFRFPKWRPFWPVFSDLILGSNLVQGRKAVAWWSGVTLVCSSLIWPWQKSWVWFNFYWRVYKMLCGLSGNFWRILSNPPFPLIKGSRIALTWAHFSSPQFFF